MGLRVVLVSLEDWDTTWRRNQHLADRLVETGVVEELLWVSPPVHGAVPCPRDTPRPGVTVVRPSLRLPRRVGGLLDVAHRLAPTTRRADVVWVNDARLGAAVARPGQGCLYDVTDDWTAYPFPPRIRRRISRAEDRMARDALVVVCSAELQRRWEERYGSQPELVRNGVDLQAYREVLPRPLLGPGPHVAYVGTLQPERLDVDLLLRIADSDAVGTLHLVGPDSLGASRQVLEAHAKIRLQEPLPADQVPAFMVSVDVLVAPHVVDAFTLSLDAIKAYEYAASGRPVVATPTSGFQETSLAGAHVVQRELFVDVLDRVLEERASPVPSPEGISWDDRAARFAHCLLRAAGST